MLDGGVTASNPGGPLPKGGRRVFLQGPPGKRRGRSKALLSAQDSAQSKMTAGVCEAASSDETTFSLPNPLLKLPSGTRGGVGQGFRVPLSSGA
jgi:hypothetical protein